MSWPLTPTHHGPSIPLQGPQPELQDRRKWAKMIGADKTFCSNEHMLFLSTTLKIDIIWLQEKFQFSLQKNQFRGQICEWIISYSQRTVLLLILGLNVHHSHCASPWRKLCWANTKPSVITDGEIAPAARPNPFACLRDDIYYQHRVQPDRLHHSLLDCEQLCDNRRNSSSAETSLPAFVSSCFQLGITAGAFVCRAKHSNKHCLPRSLQAEGRHLCGAAKVGLSSTSLDLNDRSTSPVFSAATWKLAVCPMKFVKKPRATWLREANHTNHPTSTKAVCWFGCFFPPFSLEPPGPNLTKRWQ